MTKSCKNLNDVVAEVGKTTFQDNDLSDYISVSSLLHCIDGWYYLSQALGALIDGQTGIAVHLGYYAELRAAMSLLACEGIGVFKDKHVSIDSTGKASQLTFTWKGRTKNLLGTHEATWDLLKRWATNPNKSNRALEVIYYQNFSLDKWITEAGYPSKLSTAKIAEIWILNWAKDLGVFAKKDRDLRNKVSYRPQWITPTNLKLVDTKSILKNLVSLWQMYQPFTNPTNVLLDQVLAGQVLHDAYNAINKGKKAKPNYGRYIANTLGNLGISTTGSTYKILSGYDPSTYPIINLSALANTTISNSTLPIIARASLMLRLSTAFCTQLFNVAGVKSNDLKFFWSDMGEYYGYWDSSATPKKMEDLWSNVDSVLTLIDPLVTTMTPNTNLTEYLNKNLSSRDIHTFKSIGQANLWAIGF